MSVGTATVDFGAFPGATDARATVTAQTGILSTSAVEAYVMPATTADHTVDEHWVENIKVVAGSVIEGIGFTIYARTTDNTRLYGAWNIGWVWV